MSSTLNFSIESISRITGISEFALRNWERRYNFLKPQRDQHKRRIYSFEEAILIQKAAILIQDGHKPFDVFQLANSNIQNFESLYHSHLSKNFDKELDKALDQILDSLLVFDIRKAKNILAQLIFVKGPHEIIESVYGKLLFKVGILWETGKCSIAQEHFSSHFIRAAINQLTNENSIRLMTAPKAIVVCPENELHEGGALMLSASLRLLGWEVFYFGSNLPIQEIQKIQSQIKADAVIISICSQNPEDYDWQILRNVPGMLCAGGPAIHSGNQKELSQAHQHIQWSLASINTTAILLNESLQTEKRRRSAAVADL